MPAKKKINKKTKKEIKKPIKRARKVKVNVAKKAKLSPYTVYLSRDLPDPIKMIEDETQVTAANFVDYVSLLDDPVLLETAADDLSISEAELLGQLKESDLIEKSPLLERLLKLSKLPKINIVKTASEAEAEDIFEEVNLSEEEIETPEEPVEAMDPQYVFAVNEQGEPSIIEALEEEVEEVVEEIGDTARRWSWQLEHGWKRAIAAFVLVSFAFVLPLHAMNTYRNLSSQKTDLENSGQAALGNLENATSSIMQADFQSAAGSFAQANEDFQKAGSTLNELDASLRALISLLPSTRRAYNTGVDLLKAGDALAGAATRISDAFAVMQNEINPTLVSKIEILETTLSKALPMLEDAEHYLENIELDLIPESSRDTVKTVADQLPALTASFQEFLSFSELIKTILGDEMKKRYLVIFQNNTELRPTGGFIGSFAEIDIDRGEITKITIPAGGSYDLQGSLREHIAAPEPLQLINSHWEFQDANWFPDYPASANKLIDFYENAGGPTVDGVIAINATYVADLLSLLGPIDMPEYGRTIDSENFIFETQKIVELEADESAPKQFIGDLAPKLIERIKDASANDFLNILSHIDHGLTGRDLQLYFTDHDLEQQITSLGWAGEIKRIAGDYLMVVTTNIGGGKTDAIVSEDIDLDVQISETGEITNTVTVTRTHHGIKNDLFVGVNNVDYIRLYVPRGSQLINANNFEIPPPELFERPQDYYQEDEDLSFASASSHIDPASGTDISEEFGKTVFGNWIQTKPGETEIATFTYRLPWTVQTLSEEPDLVANIKNLLGFHPIDDYTLFIQKQSGVLDRDINVQINLPDKLDLVWTSSENKEGQIINLSADETSDAFLGILFETDL